jgi:TatD DNase family protein
MIQRAIDACVAFFIPAIDSTCTQSMYDLERITQKMF